ncbi:T106C protein, partial [Columbina picui]|nr:T106C protein [Columbina picui]
MGSALSLWGHGAAARQSPKAAGGDDDDGLESRDRVEDIAKFPYVEFTGQDSITCPTCQGTGCIPTEQVNELVALIPYSDQRLRPRRTKLYVLLSVLLCLLASGLVVFFLFPHSVSVEDDGIKVVQVWFDKKNSVVTLAITVKFPLRTLTGGSRRWEIPRKKWVKRAKLRVNLGFFSLSQVNFTVKAELGGSFSYLYLFCTFPKVKVHNIVIFMRTAVKLSCIGRATQSSLETYHYVDCSTNSTAAPAALP